MLACYVSYSCLADALPLGWVQPEVTVESGSTLQVWCGPSSDLSLHSSRCNSVVGTSGSVTMRYSLSATLPAGTGQDSS